MQYLRVLCPRIAPLVFVEMNGIHVREYGHGKNSRLLRGIDQQEIVAALMGDDDSNRETRVIFKRGNNPG